MEAEHLRRRLGGHVPLMTSGSGPKPAQKARSHRAFCISALVAAVVAAPLAAQLPQADDAFTKGDDRAARAAYERALAADSLNERALYRLAILDSWDGKLARSLARFTRLRRLDPKDPDFMVAHARVLAWAGKTAVSEKLYDSVVAGWPERADALAGRARAVAWGGDLDRAEQL